MTQIALVDHGAGNLRSVQKALEAAGADVLLTAQPDEILAAAKVVLPGVGAFADVMQALALRHLAPVLQVVARRGTPFLGICVGMQVLFEESEEHGRHAGLGLLPGRVVRFPDGDLKVPHTGWNELLPAGPSRILAGLPAGSYAYFNHSYYCSPETSADVLARTEYGKTFASVVGRDAIFGVQFHPEKSQHVGLQILKNFTEVSG